MSTLPPAVIPLVDALVGSIRDALGANIVGIYIRGSLALGGFDPESSDVDLLVVVDDAVSAAEFKKLAILHERIPARRNSFGPSYEVSYIDREAIKRFKHEERVHPTVGADWDFARSPHPDNFIIERWVTREHGIVLQGPDPKTLIDPISEDDLRSAVASEFRRHMEWVDANEPPKWLATRDYQAFAIETVYRGLYTLETGTITTKPKAIAWAIETLPEPWRSLAEWSRENHADKTADPGKVAEVMTFIRWATSTLPKEGPAAAIPPEATALVDAYIASLRNALGDNLVGVYLGGSLAHGGFVRGKSDVDLVVITERLASEAEVAALAAIHERIPPLGNAFGQEYEAFYIDRASMRRWSPGLRHLRVEPDAALHWEEQRANFVIERWVVREHGVTVLGPDPRTLIAAVSSEELREAARSEVAIRLDDWAGGQPMPAWLGHRGAQGYEVETVCRALCTIETGVLPSKTVAIEWAMDNLPAKWRQLLEWTQEHRKDRTQDVSRMDEVVAFVRWAAQRASMSAE